MLNVTFIGDRELIARFVAMPDRVRQSLSARVHKLVLDLEAHVKRDKLQGQVLNHRTGALQRSIHSDVSETATSVMGRVFSNGSVNYAAIHEFGGQIKTRLGTGKISSKLHGKAFVVMPERSFLRSALEDYRQRIIESMKDAVLNEVKR